MTEPWHTSQISVLQEYSTEKRKAGIQEILKGWGKKRGEKMYTSSETWIPLPMGVLTILKERVKKLFQALTKWRDMHYMEALL